MFAYYYFFFFLPSMLLSYPTRSSIFSYFIIVPLKYWIFPQQFPPIILLGGMHLASDPQIMFYQKFLRYLWLSKHWVAFSNLVFAKNMHTFLIVFFFRSSVDCWSLGSFATQLFSVHSLLEHMPLIIVAAIAAVNRYSI